MSKKCPPGKILNPSTGRCVKKDGKIGKELLKISSPCRKGKIVSPTTKKCVQPTQTMFNYYMDMLYNALGYTEKDFKDEKRYKPVLNNNKKAPKDVKKKSPKRKSPKRKLRFRSSPNRDYDIDPPDLSYKKLETPRCIVRSKLPLRKHQEEVVKYLEVNDAVGVFHGTGWGKTLIAATASQCFLDKNPDKKVIIITPSSLVNNMKKELKNYGVKNLSSYEIYTFDGFVKKYVQSKTVCKGNMVIVDEVHNLRNIKSPGKSDMDEPVRYRAAMNCMNSASKRLVLTATPYINNINDFLPIINFIHGKRIFNEDRAVVVKRDFNEQDVIEKTWFKGNFQDKLKIISNLLKNRINYLPASELEGFPRVNEKFVQINMTKEFQRKYDKAIKSQTEAEFDDPNKFYNGYRRAVNKAGGSETQKMSEVKKILKTGKTILYTSWLEYGTEIIKSKLPKDIRYEVFTGSISQKNKKKIVEDYNEDKLDLLIITKSGAEGLDLKRTKNIIIFDPPWNESTLIQIIGRGVRNNSHVGLPEKERVVNVYKLILLENDIKGKLDLDKDNGSTTGDYILYKIINDKMKQNKKVVQELVKISFK